MQLGFGAFNFHARELKPINNQDGASKALSLLSIIEVHILFHLGVWEGIASHRAFPSSVVSLT